MQKNIYIKITMSIVQNGPGFIWALAVLLLFLLFGFFLCCFTRRQRKTKLQRICEPWGIHDQEEEELVDDEDPSDGTDRSRFYPKYSTWPLKSMEDKCSVVEELMDELLAACDAVVASYFMPRLQAPVGVGIGFEGDSREGSHAVFRMLVPLQLPPGHDFHLELGPEGEIMALIFVTALLLQRLPNVGNELDVATLDHMQQHEVYFQEQMTKMQQEIEQNRMDQSRVELQHFPSFTQWSWMIWTFTALLLFLLFGFFLCCFTRRQRKTKLQRICEPCGMHDQEEEELVDDEDPSDGTCLLYTSRCV
ncbi:UNVERIFIED_CONTAM: hypothetical protein H355_015390 [Colinus virginianus]|nr:hypothetical protein H355_015390 [Colinus virginianus]